MLGEVYLNITLCCWGNYYLRNTENIDFFPAHKAFSVCYSVGYLCTEQIPSNKTKENLLSENPNQWIEQLRLQKCLCLKFHYFEKKWLGLFRPPLIGGDGTWTLETQHSQYSDYWVAEYISRESTYEISRQPWTKNKLWRVQYHKVDAKKNKSKTKKINLDEHLQHFEKLLKELIQFTGRVGLDNFQKIFQRAFDCLKSDRPLTIGKCEEILPPGIRNLQAERLLAACYTAWVFGGMGSWNDVNFESTSRRDTEMYGSLSTDLFDLINKGIVAAVNSFF